MISGAVPVADGAEADAGLFDLAKFFDNSDDAALTCPFDTTHKIRRYRIEHHLATCRKNHPEVQVLICPYNATHVLPLKFFTEHVAGCPDHRLVDPDQAPARTIRNFTRAPGANGNPDQPSLRRFEIIASQNRELSARAAEDAGTAAEISKDLTRFVPRVLTAAAGGSVLEHRALRKAFDIKQTMRENLDSTTKGGKAYVENNVIAGGVPSLLSEGGINPVLEAAEYENLAPQPQIFEEPDDEPISLPVSVDSAFSQPQLGFFDRFRARRFATRTTANNGLPTERGGSSQTI